MTPGLEATGAFRTDPLAYANALPCVRRWRSISTPAACTILRYNALHDCGVRINPMTVEGQTRGAIAHGIGNTLFEWMGYDEAGQP